MLEAAGIVTTSVSTCRDITAAARVPRAVFLDFPNGNTTGRVGEPALTRSILTSAFDLLSESTSEVLVDLPHTWDETDSWKDRVFRPEPTGNAGEKKMLDDRVERFDTPQFQSADDASAADVSHAGEDCLVCIGIDI